MTLNTSTADAISNRASLVRRGRTLAYLTVGWNAVEALVSVVAGVIAGSVALVGFGLDSVIETSSGAVMLWRLKHSNERDACARERSERISLRLIGVSFLLLATYVAADAVWSLVDHEAPERSIAGIVIAAVSLVVMPILARAKRNVAVGLNSEAMQADSRQTDICAYLSAIVLGGLLLNATLGWWWADPIAALVMAPIIAREGVNAIRGEHCECAELPGES